VTFLLDVNVLIALIDPGHVAHDDAHQWFSSRGAADWATCPITENGVIRIVGHPRYPQLAGIAGGSRWNCRQAAQFAGPCFLARRCQPCRL
jgi:predicted nucleic acid-binding protein